MSLRDLVRRRRSVRAFTDREVAHEVLAQVLSDAAYAPSGGNVQPWRVIVLRGSAMADLKRRMRVRLTDPKTAAPTPDYPIYPQPLKSPYRERRFRNGEQMYALLGISREDRSARLRHFDRNYVFFDAPVGLFIYIDREMGRPQWADLGIFLMTLMLLLSEQGIDTCPQAAWANYHNTVAEVTRPGDDLMLYCGLAIGYADPDKPVNRLRTERDPLETWCRFID